MVDEEMKNGNGGGGDSGEPASGNGDSSQTDGCFKDYHEKVLKKEIEGAESTKKVKETVFAQKYTVKNFRTCTLLRAQAACDEYTNIKNCITTILGQSAVEIQANIDAYITYGKDTETALTAAFKAIKGAKSKLAAVNDAACRLENCIKDSCNSEQLRILKDGFDELIVKGKTEKTFIEHINEIQSKVDMANDTGLGAFEIGVKVAGIQKFTNIKSLKGFGNNLQEGIDLLVGDVAENVTYSKGKKEKAQEELTTALQELTTAKFKKFNATLKLKSLKESEKYVLGPHLPTDTIEEICTNVEASFEACVPE